VYTPSQKWTETSSHEKLTVKPNPCLFVVTPVLGMKMKQWEIVIWFFRKINLSRTISMKRSRRELSIDMVIHRDIFKYNEITLFLSVT